MSTESKTGKVIKYGAIGVGLALAGLGADKGLNHSEKSDNSNSVPNSTISALQHTNMGEKAWITGYPAINSSVSYDSQRTAVGMKVKTHNETKVYDLYEKGYPFQTNTNVRLYVDTVTTSYPVIGNVKHTVCNLGYDFTSPNGEFPWYSSNGKLEQGTAVKMEVSNQGYSNGILYLNCLKAIPSQTKPTKVAV
ncbi:MAG TPA: hypothetical protein VMR41_00430 [Patescibacteria group bacterium]|nr:hypothetical protein [Patescibacteria group bacterium]